MPQALIDTALFSIGDELVKLLDDQFAVPVRDDHASANGEVLVLSAAKAAQLGSREDLLARARAVGAKRIIMVEESATTFALAAEMNGRLAKLSVTTDQLSDGYAVTLAGALIQGGHMAPLPARNSRSLLRLARRLAQSDISVFISGPTGSGKEVLAKFVHDCSERAAKPFIAINCAAIPENMLEAMLFGHEKGAFTGASAKNVGIIRAADTGTLLLDEVSEMSLPLQAKLLRVLQERMITPVGSTAQIPVDIRILATSNRDIPTECRAGRFREDLYYRLNVFPIATEGLRDRPADILPLALSLMLRHTRRPQDLALLSAAAIEKLRRHDWPGNVRELENVIQRALVLSNGPEIRPEDIMIDAGTAEVTARLRSEAADPNTNQGESL